MVAPCLDGHPEQEAPGVQEATRGYRCADRCADHPADVEVVPLRAVHRLRGDAQELALSPRHAAQAAMWSVPLPSHQDNGPALQVPCWVWAETSPLYDSDDYRQLHIWALLPLLQREPEARREEISFDREVQQPGVRRAGEEGALRRDPRGADGEGLAPSPRRDLAYGRVGRAGHDDGR